MCKYRLPVSKAFFIALGLAVAVGTPAQGYPERPVKLIVGFAPGGSSDTVARLIGQKLAPVLGQPVVIENKPGAGGVLGADLVAKAPSDGYTLLLAVSGHATAAAMMKKLPFEPVKDFAWVTMLTTYPFVFATSPQAPFKSLAEFMAQAKAQPGKLSYSSVGVGSAHHLVGEWFNAETGANLLHVPFRGGSATIVEVLAGRVDIMVETVTLALSHIQAGKLRALGVTAREPVAFLPGVPTLNQVVPGFEYQSWLGVAAPAGTPSTVVERLNREIRRVLDQPDMRQRLAELGGAAAHTSPSAMRAEVETQIARWQRLVESRGIEKQ